MSSIRIGGVALVGSVLSCIPLEAVAGCDATVSATAIQLARQAAVGDETAISVALESFEIAPAFADAFRPALTQALRAEAPQDAAAAMTLTLRQMCNAFAGNAGVAPLVPAAVSATMVDLGKRRASTADALERIKEMANDLDATAPPGNLQADDAKDSVSPNANGESNADREQESARPRKTLHWLARPSQNRTRQQIELSVLEAKASLDTVTRNREANDPSTDDADVTKAKALFTQAEQNALLLLPSYGLFVGPNYTQNSVGGFDVGIEAYGRWDSGRYFYGRCDPDCSESGLLGPGWYRGFFDATFQDTDVTDKSTEVPDAGGGGEDGDGAGGDEIDIFGRDKGRLRLNAGVHWHPFVGLGEASDWLGLVGGVGFTAPQVTGGGDALNRGGVRWFTGIHSVTRYRHGLGELSLGYAKDRFWNTKCAEDPAQAIAGCGDFSSRYFIEGMFNLVNAEATDWSLIGKISADIPTRSGGESDVVVSVMLRRDLSGYFNNLAGD
jgi:hypothetical protein